MQVFVFALLVFFTFAPFLLLRLARQQTKIFTFLCQQNTENFTLTETGEYQSQHAHGQLSEQCQSNFFGYWLVFYVIADQSQQYRSQAHQSQQNQSQSATLNKHFIFKDGLNRQDQARLARIIIRMQKAQ